jgi:hypothetical protein
LETKEKHKTHIAQKLDESPFAIELTIGEQDSFYDALLEAIDNSFSSLGESAKTSIYFHLENTMGIRKREIPFRIEDFQNALEKIFGMGTRHLEILFIKNLHEKLKIKYYWDMPRWVVPELTFKEYIRLAKIEFENSNEKNNEQK